MTLLMNGIGASRGIAIGKVHILERGQPEVVEYCVPESEAEAEVQRLERALDTAKQQLKNTRQRIPVTTPTDIVEFIDTHLLMLDDATLIDIPAEIIRHEHCNAEWALKKQLDRVVDVFDEMDDPYLRTRKDDVIHVVSRVLHNLQSESTTTHSLPPMRDGVVIADDLTPADIVMLQHQGILGFVTESGGPLSHTAIMARSLRIPAVMGTHNARRYFKNEEIVIIDGTQGVVFAGATDALLNYYRSQQEEEHKYFLGLSQIRDRLALSLDGTPIQLFANIELPEDLQAALAVNADGVGLFRTEYLFMNRATLPDEEEQLHAYHRIIEVLDGKPLTIRSLDLGADKTLQVGLQKECPNNPALGLRAIRLCLKDPALFRPQLRAVLRASAFGPVRLMIPMLSNIQEILQVLHILEDLKKELRAEGLAYDRRLPVGGMIEVPAAAISASHFARHLDFLSIGTNDLIQYTLAIDRIDDEVNYLYDPCHPSVLRLIYQVIKAGNHAGIPVAMCGEMAGDPQYTRLLLGLGLRELSMQPAALLEVKNRVLESSIPDMIRPCRAALKCMDAEETRQHLHTINL